MWLAALARQQAVRWDNNQVQRAQHLLKPCLQPTSAITSVYSECSNGAVASTSSLQCAGNQALGLVVYTQMDGLPLSADRCPQQWPICYDPGENGAEIHTCNRASSAHTLTHPHTHSPNTTHSVSTNDIQLVAMVTPYTAGRIFPDSQQELGKPYNPPYPGGVAVQYVTARHLQVTWGRAEKQASVIKGIVVRRKHCTYKEHQLAQFSSLCEVSIVQTRTWSVKWQQFSSPPSMINCIAPALPEVNCLQN